MVFKKIQTQKKIACAALTEPCAIGLGAELGAALLKLRLLGAAEHVEQPLARIDLLGLFGERRVLPLAALVKGLALGAQLRFRMAKSGVF
jgi:hypothetical protein